LTNHLQYFLYIQYAKFAGDEFGQESVADSGENLILSFKTISIHKESIYDTTKPIHNTFICCNDILALKVGLAY